MPDFADYLDKATAHIRDAKKRSAVREELSSHLNDIAELNMSKGLSEEDAVQKAVEEMGDAGSLSYELGEIHSFFPAQDLKDSITLFITGFLLVSIYFDFWYLKPITTGIGTALILLALCRLAPCGRLFRLSLIFFAVSLFSGSAIEVISALPVFPTLNAGVMTVLWYVDAFLSTAAYVLVMCGVIRLLPENESTRLRVATIAYALVTPFVMIINAGALIFLIVVVAAADMLGAAKRYLWANGFGEGMRELPKKRTVAVLGAAVIACALPYMISAAVTLLPSAEVYYRGEETEQVQAVKRELLSGGLDAELLDDMLCDDILLLDGAKVGEVQTLYASAADGGETEYDLYPFIKDGSYICVLRYEHTSVPEKTRARQIYVRTDGWKYGTVTMPTDGKLSPGHGVSLYDRDKVTMRTRSYVTVNEYDGGMEYSARRRALNQRGYFIFSAYCPGCDMSEYDANVELIVRVYDQDRLIRLPFGYDNISQQPAFSEADMYTETRSGRVKWDMSSAWQVSLSEAMGITEQSE